jgi:hypothetical protein
MGTWLPNPGIFLGKKQSLKSPDSLWIKIAKRKINNQLVQASSVLALEPATDTYYFLAARELQETTNHTWEPMENAVMGVAQKAGKIAQAIELGGAVFKVDSPLNYQSSNRRNFTIAINLVWSGIGSIDSEVLKPILDFQGWSAPQTTGDLSGAIEAIELPFAFSVHTVNSSGGIVQMLNMEAGALTSVQSTYKSPFVQGKPTHADLFLTFTDIGPLTKKSFDKNQYSVSSSSSGS